MRMSLAPSTKKLSLFTVSLAIFMDVLDSNIINTSIPAMSRSLNVNPIDLKIALLSYLLSLAIFIPTSGWAADKYGSKRIFIGAFGLFIFASFFCGYASNLTQLVIARCIQGMGAAFMISLGRLIIAQTFKRHELVEAMNTVIIVVSVAVMLGPFIGGFITDQLSWPWIFWVNIPIGIVAAFLANYSLKDNSPRRAQPFDLPGFILFGGSLALLCFSLSELSESNVSFSLILGLISLSLLMLVIYVFHAKRSPHPLIQIKLLNRRSFRISVMGNVFARLGFGGMPFLLPLLQQVGLGYSAQLSGLLLAPMAFGIIFSKLFALHALRWMGYRRYLFANTLCVALILWIFQIINADTSAYTIAVLTFIFGIFLSSQFTGMNSLAFADIHEDELSASTSITSTVQILGQSLGVAVAAILLRYFSSFPGEQANLLTIPIFHQAFFAMGIITILSSVIFIRLKADDGKEMLVKHNG
jgi:EmrB/QacA subfamily drug resistance transporter